MSDIDMERLKIIKDCWLKYGKISEKDAAWLFMKLESKLIMEGWKNE